MVFRKRVLTTEQKKMIDDYNERLETLGYFLLDAAWERELTGVENKYVIEINKNKCLYSKAINGKNNKFYLEKIRNKYIEWIKYLAEKELPSFMERLRNAIIVFLNNEKKLWEYFSLDYFNKVECKMIKKESKVLIAKCERELRKVLNEFNIEAKKLGLKPPFDLRLPWSFW